MAAVIVAALIALGYVGCKPGAVAASPPGLALLLVVPAVWLLLRWRKRMLRGSPMAWMMSAELETVTHSMQQTGVRRMHCMWTTMVKLVLGQRVQVLNLPLLMVTLS